MRIKFISLFISFSIVMVFQGCTPSFTRVDFKYTSLAHISPAESMIIVNGYPENIIYKLTEWFRNNNATILERKKVDYYFILNDSSHACWQAICEIYNAEFESYKNNNYRQYKKIDRVAPFKNRGLDQDCKMLNQIKDNKINSWFLVVEFNDRSGSITVPTTDTFFAINNNNNYAFGESTNSLGKNINIDLATRLKFWVSEGPGEGKSTVYIEGIPTSSQIVAASGNSIGHSWWQITNGYEEYKVVKNYLNFIQELDREKTFLIK